MSRVFWAALGMGKPTGRFEVEDFAVHVQGFNHGYREVKMPPKVAPERTRHARMISIRYGASDNDYDN